MTLTKLLLTFDDGQNTTHWLLLAKKDVFQRCSRPLERHQVLMIKLFAWSGHNHLSLSRLSQAMIVNALQWWQQK